MKNRAIAGFSLIELMAAIAIVAVLAAIAVPSYSSFVYTGELRTATADVKALSLNIENQYQKTLSYKDLTASSDLSEEFKGWKKSSTTFGITVVSNAAASTYTITGSGSATGYTGCKIELQQNGSCVISGCKSGNTSNC